MEEMVYMKSQPGNDLYHSNSSKIDYFSGMGHDWDNIVGNDDERIQAITEVFEMIDLHEGSLVLDVGTGNGVLLPIIESYAGPRGKIFAVDAAPGMIERAIQKHGHYGNITFMVGSVETVELPEKQVDVILCFAVFPHIDDKAAALRRFSKILKPGGALYIFHMSDTRSLNEFHGSLDAPVKGDHMPERDELETMLLEASFTLDQYIDRTGLNFVKAVPAT